MSEVFVKLQSQGSGYETMALNCTVYVPCHSLCARHLHTASELDTQHVFAASV